MTGPHDRGADALPVGPHEAILAHNVRQRSYFESSDQRTLRPTGSRYLQRHIDHMLDFAHIRAGDRVLEVGCGMGRYTFLLADRGIRVEGLDLSPKLIERVAADSRARYGVALPLHAFDVIDAPEHLHGEFDAVVGFFILHHVHDVARAIAAAARLVRPGGSVAFLEPNPFNPLYYVQIALTPEMAWRAERGMLHMRWPLMSPWLEEAGLRNARARRFGFFPPFLANRPGGLALESVVERALPDSVLAFQLFGGDRP